MGCPDSPLTSGVRGWRIGHVGFYHSRPFVLKENKLPPEVWQWLIPLFPLEDMDAQHSQACKCMVWSEEILSGRTSIWPLANYLMCTATFSPFSRQKRNSHMFNFSCFPPCWWYPAANIPTPLTFTETRMLGSVHTAVFSVAFCDKNRSEA